MMMTETRTKKVLHALYCDTLFRDSVRYSKKKLTANPNLKAKSVA